MKKIIFVLIIISSCTPFVKDNNDKDFFKNTVIYSDISFLKSSLKYEVQNMHHAIGSNLINAMGIIDSNIIAMVDSKNRLFILDGKFNTLQELSFNTNHQIEFISPTLIVKVSKNDFYVYDLTLDKIFKFHYYNNKTMKKWDLEKTLPLISDITGLTSINILPNSVLLATSINNNNGRLIKFKIEPRQKILKYIGKRINIEGNNDFVTGLAYHSCGAYDKSTGNTFVSYYYSDLMESYDKEGHLLFRLQSPENFQPNYRTKGEEKNQRFVENKDTKVAYQSIASDDKYIYALYSGKNNTFGLTEKQLIFFDLKKSI